MTNEIQISNVKLTIRLYSGLVLTEDVERFEYLDFGIDLDFDI